MNNFDKNQKIKKAVILAGGLGTRFLPATLALAKELFPICEKPILMYHIEDLLKAGVTDILIVGNKLKEESFLSFLKPSKEYLDKIISDGKMSFLENYNEIMGKVKVSYINQEVGEEYFSEKNYLDKQCRGSSIAILACKEWANGEPFIVFNGDDFCTYDDGHSVSGELINVYNNTNDYIIFGKEVEIEKISSYSSMKLGEKLLNKNSYKLLDIIEKPNREEAPSNIMGFARYVFNSDVFEKIISSKPNNKGEYCITDVISDVAQSGNASACIFTGNYFDCGSKLGLQMAGNYVLMQDKNNRDFIINEIERLKNNLNKIK